MKPYKTLAYIPLHYGCDYLEAVMRSIVDDVDRILILYTAAPSYGHSGHLKNPDSREELKRITSKFPKVIWKDIRQVSRENIHRKMADEYAHLSRENFDLILAVDADEIWKPGTLAPTLEKAFYSNYRFHNIHHAGWYHFWKSKDEVNKDGFQPMRITNLNNYAENSTTVTGGTIWHMGYAISEKAMAYKLSCHGHKSEIPGSWYQDKWLNYKKGETKYLHPATDAYWIETREAPELPDWVKVIDTRR